MFNFLHCPLSGPDLIYISLLIISCIIEYVTNTKNLEPWINVQWKCLVFATFLALTTDMTIQSYDYVMVNEWFNRMLQKLKCPGPLTRRSENISVSSPAGVIKLFSMPWCMQTWNKNNVTMCYQYFYSKIITVFTQVYFTATFICNMPCGNSFLNGVFYFPFFDVLSASQNTKCIFFAFVLSYAIISFYY